MTSFAEFCKRRRDQVAACKLVVPADVADLPWMGNHAADYELFNAVDAFILRLPTLAERAEAIRLMGLYGMGEDSVVTETDAMDYVETLRGMR